MSRDKNDKFQKFEMANSCLDDVFYFNVFNALLICFLCKIPQLLIKLYNFNIYPYIFIYYLLRTYFLYFSYFLFFYFYDFYTSTLYADTDILVFYYLSFVVVFYSI